MELSELYKIIEQENRDSEIIAMSLVVKDSNNGQITNYFVNQYGGLDCYNIEQ